jgi:hypothetical protein
MVGTVKVTLATIIAGFELVPTRARQGRLACRGWSVSWAALQSLELLSHVAEAQPSFCEAARRADGIVRTESRRPDSLEARAARLTGYRSG